jgi:5-methylcytosine-specific restriction protein A
MIEVPYQIGALYNRQVDIHGRLGGQQQGGISTPIGFPVIIIFTGEAGFDHGYRDFWDDNGVFHYFGEGQRGDMSYSGGNKAVLTHEKNGKALLLFQMMGRGKPYRYLGQFRVIGAYESGAIPDTTGAVRKAIIFRMVPVESDADAFDRNDVAEADEPLTPVSLDSTVSVQESPVRKKQALFKRRLLEVEKECRLTGIRDLRFLRASHIKPWAACDRGEERIDGNNGLLLCPQADLLFDQGWITFGAEGELRSSSCLPSDVLERIGIDLRNGRSCGQFKSRQQSYLDFHRNEIYEQKFLKTSKSLDSMFDELLKTRT